ncbi:Acylphosphate phosphohydrolase [Acidisarcina polymorpha]|uniref:Acylphosphatase n=1 Tax=Acidisarcina polymorpha TaxID=2211140 RepID=A0A2Z5G423_9BACT|nr:acylphosphatase [Acidisarcina polymorpha]AXC13467.1 Acylphosphate phosphohydrolase [Acidisarcina polymorpha]
MLARQQARTFARESTGPLRYKKHKSGWVAPHFIICNTDLEAMVHHYLVKGRVQGVGFRWFVHREAAELNLRGWVRNTEDGHVEIVAAGEPKNLELLQQALRKGSRGSRVDAVLRQELAETEAEGFGPFHIEGAW